MSLYSHQIRGVAEVIKESRCLWWDMGTGKTAVMLAALHQQRLFPALVLCPKTIIWAAWLADAKKFFPQLHIQAITGTKEQRSATLNKTWGGDDQLEVAVMGYEAARATPELLDIPWQTIIYDESTRLRFRRSSVNFKMAQKLSGLPSVKRRYALSGNPIPNGIMEIWGQIHVVQPRLLPESFYAFRNEYFYQPNKSNAQWLWVPKPGSEDKITERIKPLCSYLNKKTCVDLPPQTDEIRHIALKEEAAVYRKFLSEFLVELEEGKVTSYSALAELMKCRQITAGMVRCDDGKWREVGTSKLDATVELVEDIGKPVVIVAQFRAEIERLASALTKEHRLPVLLYGDMTDKDRMASIDKFNGGMADVLIGHPASMGHGLTLKAADMIFPSLDYSWDTHGQVRERLAPLRGRGDSKSPCTYYYLIAPGTIDEDIYASLSKKQSVGLEILWRLARKGGGVTIAQGVGEDRRVLVEDDG